MIRRILVGLGGTQYTQSATRHAIELAQAHDATLAGVSIIDYDRLTNVGPIPLGGAHYAAELREERMAQARNQMEIAVNQFASECDTAGVRYQVYREEGEPFSKMIDLARFYDLMVFGLRSLFEFDVIDDPHDALVRLVTAGVRPVLAVDREYRPIRKALIAFSGSMESAKTMKRFVQLALWPGMELRVVNFADGNAEAEKHLVGAAEYCEAYGFKVETDCVTGAPRDQLLQYAADWGADLLVIGNSSRNLLMRRVFGETSLHVIRNGELPLFIAQ